ncbi:MAG: hypothetical protein WCF65_09065 [Parachlamydiaceae bacterium]
MHYLSQKLLGSPPAHEGQAASAITVPIEIPQRSRSRAVNPSNSPSTPPFQFARMTKVMIRAWNPDGIESNSDGSYDSDEIDTKSDHTVKHLDIGSANSSIEYTHSPEHFTKTVHQVLFAVADHLICTHSPKKEFVFYLNDISGPGLDQAAENLAEYLKDKYSDKGLIIKIEKIVRDIFSVSDLPLVDSSTFLHPFRCIAFDLLSTTFPAEKKQALNKMICKVASASKTGLLIKEINVGGWALPLIKSKMSEGFRHEGLEYKLAEAPHIPIYTTPQGNNLWSDEDLCYLVSK